MESITHRVAGQPFTGSSDRSGQVFNPATGEIAAEVSFANTADADRAVAAAKEAFPGWRDTSLSARQQVLFAYRELVRRHVDDLALAVSLEHGKTIEDARGEVSRGLEVIEFACGIANHLKGDYSENVSTGIDTYTVRQPLGVAVGISPFNFPVMVPMWMYPIAIAAGNTFVLKPSEKDPSPSVLMADLFSEAGLPDGVFNVLHGDAQAVEHLIAHPDVAAVSFVGSTPVARHIYEHGTSQGKRVQALAGAKNHMVVLPDADMDLAADAAVSAGYGSAGERCMAISVVVTVGEAAEQLLPRIKERIAGLKISSGQEPGCDMGPLVTEAHRERVVGYINEGVVAGAKLLVDGRGIEVPGYDGGFFVGPTLFDDVRPGMSIYDDEIFGPVLSIVRVDTYNEAIQLINDNPWGNGTAVFTHDGGTARKFQNEIQVGMVGINLPIPVPLGFYSFGGWKSSIFGDHPVYGPEGVHFYTRPKVMISRWSDPVERGVDLGFPQQT